AGGPGRRGSIPILRQPAGYAPSLAGPSSVGHWYRRPPGTIVRRGKKRPVCGQAWRSTTGQGANLHVPEVESRTRFINSLASSVPGPLLEERLVFPVLPAEIKERGEVGRCAATSRPPRGHNSKAGGAWDDAHLCTLAHHADPLDVTSPTTSRP
ncbi:hypothetical protein V5799_000792, partial [Amblyomma americanum]